jgi:hypothetical protein
MEIEVLHIGECPGWEPALDGVKEALVALGRSDVEVTERVLLTEEAAAGSAFAGSPTIVVDGADLFPSDGRTSALACRIYATEHGIAPAPSVGQIVAALRDRPVAEPSTGD